MSKPIVNHGIKCKGELNYGRYNAKLSNEHVTVKGDTIYGQITTVAGKESTARACLS
jgi:hypothetical protein